MTNRTKVLLIDDDEDSFVITRNLISRVADAAIDLEWSRTFDHGLEAIRTRAHDAYLIDYHLGSADGIELLRIAVAEGCRAPLIILTGQGEHAIDIQAMKEGAADFLVKGRLDGIVIERSIRFAIERCRTAEELLKHQAQLRMLTEQMPAILWTTDRQLRFTSSWGAGLLGLNLLPNEVVGLTLYEYFQTESKKHSTIDSHLRALDGESISYQADWLGRKYRVHVNPLRHNGDHIIGAVGVALDITHAKQLESEFTAARVIQEGLLPKHPPSISGLDIAGVCRPMAATGGDYFDFITMPNGSLGIVIADVSGHGFASALITMETRRLLRTLVQWQFQPHDALIAANHALCEHPDHGRKFVTLFFARIEPQTRLLTYATAGHEGYLFRDTEEAVTILENLAIPLGIMDDAKFFHCGPVQLNSGDLLLLFTDGIDEAHVEGGSLFGKQRVFDIVHSNRHRPASEIVDTVVEEVLKFNQNRVLQDDLTLIVLKVNADY